MSARVSTLQSYQPVLAILSLIVRLQLMPVQSSMTDTNLGPVLALISFYVSLTFKYTSVFGNLIGFLCCRPTTLRRNSSISPLDCSVILPVTNVADRHLEECIRSILHNYVRTIYITASSWTERDLVHEMVGSLRYEFPETSIQVGAISEVNKRRQVAHAVRHISSKITILADVGVC